VTIQEIARALSEGNRNLILGIMIPPPGYSLKELENVGRFVEEELRRYWEAEPGDSLDAPLPCPISFSSPWARESLWVLLLPIRFGPGN